MSVCPVCEGFGDDPLGCEACDNTGLTKAITPDEIERVARAKVTPEAQQAWVEYEPIGQFSETMSFARFNGMMRHAFLSGHVAAMDPERLREPATGEIAALVKMLVEGVGQEFDGELHLTEEQAFTVARRLEAQEAEIASLREQIAALRDELIVISELDGPNKAETVRQIHECARVALSTEEEE